MSLATQLANLFLAKGLRADELPYLSEHAWATAVEIVRPSKPGFVVIPGDTIRHRVAELMK
jgi:hypothetical protein